MGIKNIIKTINENEKITNFYLIFLFDGSIIHLSDEGLR